MIKLSVVIITLNEERNIERCLQSVQDVADEILVVDSFSTDRTAEICERYNVRFLQHAFDGHIQQKNWARDQASYDYILSLDADEALTGQLEHSIRSVKENWTHDAYYFNRLTNYCGKWIRHTSWYPARKLRLWDRRKGEWGGINPHDRFILEKGATHKHLKGDLLHYSYYNIQEHIQQINKFTDIYAKSYFEKGQTANYFKIVVHPLWRGFRDYFLKGGFLDGFFGLVISVNSAHETFLKYVKLRKLTEEILSLPRTKVCFFNSTVAWGGGEKWHYDIATRLYQRGYETVVVTNKKSELYYRIRNTRLRLYSIRVSNLSFLSFYKVLKIARILRRERVKTIILNLSADLKVAGLAAKLAGVEHIIYRRGSAIPISDGLLNRFLFRNVVTRIIANSEETMRTINMNNPNLFRQDRISVIYNGINIKKYDDQKYSSLFGRKNGEVVIGNAGRLVKQKGQKYLIDLAVFLREKDVNFKIVIAGEGKLKDELTDYAKARGVENYIEFLGFVENIKAFMMSIDIFCLTSLWEGFGYVIVEALACKKPVVAFNISSNPEIIEHEKDGYLVENMDVKTMADRIELLASDDKLRRQFGQRGRQNVENIFDIDRTLEQVETLINSL
jgi:glycosyltransferase involved in cell wall biosynthesis